MGGLQGGNIGRWYCLHRAGYTAVRTIQLLFKIERDLVWGICVCRLYVYAGYMHDLGHHSDFPTLWMRERQRE